MLVELKKDIGIMENQLKTREGNGTCIIQEILLIGVTRVSEHL